MMAKLDATPVSQDQLVAVVGALELLLATKTDLADLATLLEHELPHLAKAAAEVAPAACKPLLPFRIRVVRDPATNLIDVAIVEEIPE